MRPSRERSGCGCCAIRTWLRTSAAAMPVLAGAPVLAEAPVLDEAPVLAEAPALAEAPVLAEAPALAEPPVLAEAPALAEAPRPVLALLVLPCAPPWRHDWTPSCGREPSLPPILHRLHFRRGPRAPHPPQNTTRGGCPAT